jgi:ribosomal RNA-processing protein 12
MVFAGLAAQSNVMKADAVATITLMIDKFYPNLKNEFINEITKLIFLLLKEHNNEVYKSIIVYIKSLIKHKSPLNVTMF